MNQDKKHLQSKNAKLAANTMHKDSSVLFCWGGGGGLGGRVGGVVFLLSLSKIAIGSLLITILATRAFPLFDNETQGTSLHR